MLVEILVLTIGLTVAFVEFVTLAPSHFTARVACG